MMFDTLLATTADRVSKHHRASKTKTLAGNSPPSDPMRILHCLLALLLTFFCRAGDHPAAQVAARGRQFLVKLINPEMHLLPEFAGLP